MTDSAVWLINWKPGIGETAKASWGNAKSGVYRAPYEPSSCKMPTVGLWPRAIKLNPSWKTEGNKSTWIKTWWSMPWQDSTVSQCSTNTGLRSTKEPCEINWTSFWRIIKVKGIKRKEIATGISPQHRELDGLLQDIWKVARSWSNLC